MAEDIQLTDPHRFGLSSFAELLAPRDPIIGEEPGSYEAVHAGIMASLAPLSAYECVIAENLVAIEWELLQRRKMREDFRRQKVTASVQRAIVDRKRSLHEIAIEAAWDDHVRGGGTEENWEEPFSFDREAVQDFATSLTERVMSSDLAIRMEAWEELKTFDLNFSDIMSRSYFDDPYSFVPSIGDHSGYIVSLEKRRREVLRDYDHLQKLRPIEAEVIEA